MRDRVIAQTAVVGRSNGYELAVCQDYRAPVKRFGTLAGVLAMAAAAAACGAKSGSGVDAGGPSSTSVAATTVAVPSTVAGTTVPPSNLTLRVTEVHLVNSEESDSGMRILLPAGVATASVTLTGLPSPNQVISVCQARGLDSRLTGAACRTPANDEAVNVTLGAAASGVEIVQVGVNGSGPGANTARLDAVVIRYAASSRELNVRLPQIAAGEQPAFALTPAGSGGSYRAALTWTVIPVFGGTASSGQVQLLQNGSVASQAQGGAAGVQLEGTVPAPAGDVSIRLQNIGEAALVSPKLAALLP